MGIFSKDGQTLYGGTGFHGFDWKVPSLELAGSCAKVPAGKASRLRRSVFAANWRFEHVSANRIWGTIDVLNEASWRTAERPVHA